MSGQNKGLVVIKIGSSSLVSEEGEISSEKVNKYIGEIAELKDNGYSVIIVTSGAVALGYKQLGFRKKPRFIAAKQAAAAIGQGRLIEEYIKQLLQYGYTGAQILLNKTDFSDKRRYHNIYNILDVMLRKKIVPIINENDCISIDEITFGDNDTLAAMVAGFIHANLLVLLTDIDGLYTENPKINPDAKRIDMVEEITAEIEKLAGDTDTKVGTGGMKSKVEAAKIAVTAGVPVYICHAEAPHILMQAVNGTATGTYFCPKNNSLNTKMQWIAFHSEAQGILFVDDGAKKALEENNKSLLPSGIKKVEGTFPENAVVEVRDLNNNPIGRGICNFSSDVLETIIGKSSAEVKNINPDAKEEVIHRNKWISNKQVNQRRCSNE